MSLITGLGEGDVFAGYTILRLLGSGGMGEVYLAQHPRLPRHDALKILPADLTANGEYRQRFNREADLAAQLWHPHIVGIHDRGEFHGQLWIAMDYVQGTDAAQLLRTRYRSGMPTVEVVEVVSAVADALDHAHSRGLLHRDVKPANILLGEPNPRGRRILLADFGIARRVDEISGLTETNMLMGTTAYCAPEQLKGADIDGRADQYALACTAFHLLTGSAPFQHSNAAVVIAQHLSELPPLIGQRRPDLAALNAVLARALAKNPDERYASCSDFAAALGGQSNTVAAQLPATVAAAWTTADTAPPVAAAVVSTPPIATPPKAGRRGRAPLTLVLAIAAVVLLATVVVAGGYLLHNRAIRSADSSPSQSADSGSPGAPAPGNSSPPASAAIHLARYITDQSGVLGPVERAAVERAIDKLAAARNAHLWVVYVDSFGGLRPLRWAEDTMRANGLADNDALLAIATDDRSFTFRVPGAVTNGTSVDVEAIRRNHIEPAVRRTEWARAAVVAANGLESGAS